MTPAIYRIVLDTAGYYEMPSTEAAVRSMFHDYVDAGYFSNIDSEDVDDISIQEICAWFLRQDRREKRRQARESGEKDICTFTPFLRASDNCSTETKSTNLNENSGK